MFSYYIIDKNFEKLLALDLKEHLKNKPVIFFCVGTDKWTVDCFGPITGTILKKKYKLNNMIFGDLDKCINKDNYLTYYNLIRDKFPNHTIVIIDTALCDYQNIGIVRFGKGGIKVGSALNKDCRKSIGDYYITSNIDIIPYQKNDKLPMPSLGKVYLYAQKVSKAIDYALN